MIKRSNRSRRNALPDRWRRLPLMEPLEGRTVLSACGLACGLVDGVLSVQGTAADDLIAIRYDANTASVAVVGRDEELIGQFPLADVRGLNVNGMGGNDQLQVDSQLQLAVHDVNGADGESPSTHAASEHAHQHGTTVGTAVPSSAALTSSNLGPSLVPSLGPILGATQAPSFANASNTTDPTVATVGSLVTDHSSHGSFGAAFGLETHPHNAVFAGGMIATAASASPLQNHNHVANYQGPSSAAFAGAVDPFNLSSGSETQRDSESTAHGRHTSTASPSETPSKLVPKRCTVTQTGGLVVTSVDGKRQCDCDQKKQAAEEIARQLAGKDAAPGTGLALALADCLPCQQSALLVGLPEGFQTCSLPPGAPGLPFAGLEHPGGPSCPAKSSSAAEATESIESPWLAGLQVVGWSLLATSVALLPMLRERKDEDREVDEAAVPAVDWLFARFNVELLLAR